MARTFDEIPIKLVADGDIVDRDGEQARVVHRDRTAADSILVTFKTDNGATFDAEYPLGTVVNRFPEATWESGGSPTPHAGES